MTSLSAGTRRESCISRFNQTFSELFFVYVHHRLLGCRLAATHPSGSCPHPRKENSCQTPSLSLCALWLANAACGRQTDFQPLDTRAEDQWITDGVAPDTIRSMKATATDLKSILPEDIRAAAVTFYIVPELYEAARFERSQRLIYSFTSPAAFPKLGQAVLAHEYGHALFADSVARFAPRLTDYDKRTVDTIQLYPFCKFYEHDRSTLANQIAAASQAGDQALAGELQNSLNQLDEKCTRFLELRTHQDEDKAIAEQILPYNELWADVVAVVTLRDLDAMKYIEDDPTRGSVRSFKSNVEPASWTETEPHGLLTPVRSHLGKTLLRNAAHAGDACRTRFLSEVFQAIAEEIEARIPTDGLSVPAVNSLLIERLGKDGIPGC